MAIKLRTATATNFNLFELGDVVGILSTTLVGVGQEMAEKLNTSVRDWNLNELLEYPVPTLNYEDADRRMDFTMDLSYSMDGLDKEFVTYLNKYFGWVEPTTGEFAGMKSCLEAYHYVVRSINYGNGKLLETLAVKDMKGTSEAPDNGVDSIASRLSLPFSTRIDATGQVEKIAQNYFVLLDLQEGLPLA